MSDATPSSAAGKRLYLIDGSGYIFRAFHSLPPLTRPDGVVVGAVYGFTNMMLKMRDSIHESDYCAVIFDVSRQTFRNEIYADYKAHRPPAPDDLIPQFAIVREATRALNLPCIELEGFEADDLIASYAKAGKEAGMEVIVVTSDKDLMQLICDGVSLLDPIKQKPIGEKEVMEKFGVEPCKVIHAQALIGDSTDNVPGVPGIGPKTAAELINQFGTLEAVLANAHTIKQDKRRQSLIDFADQARLSFQLVTLKDDVPLPEPLEALHPKAIDPAVLGAFVATQNFKSLMARVGKFGGAADASRPVFAAPASEGSHPAPAITHPAVKADYSLVTDLSVLKDWVAKANSAGLLAVDTETTGLDPMQAALVGISLALTPGKACYIPLAHVGEGELIAQEQPSAPTFDLFAAAPAPNVAKLIPGQLPMADVLAVLKPLLENPAVLKIGQNIKYDMQIFAGHGIQLQSIDDTMLLSYVLDAGLGNHNMDDMAERLLGYKTITFSDVMGSGRGKLQSFAQVPLEAALNYAAEDADITLRLYDLLKARLVAEKMVCVYETIERPLIPVLRDMEREGIKVDRATLVAMSADFATRLAVLEKEIHALAGMEFSIASPKQLGEVLFDKLQLPGGKKSKTGAYGTGADVLEELVEQGHELPAKVLAWRQLAKLKSTYTDALAEQINPKTGRVHTSFAMAIAQTGRLSSSDPNLQNIPIRSEEGRKIRHAFVAEKGMKLISVDYSQIELRLLAHVADISVLKEAFLHGKDIHAATASQMFGVPLDQIDSEWRRKAKGINFGIIYGISAHGLAANLGISRGEAAAYIEQYFKQYPGIKAYMDAAKQYAHVHGYVKTLYGRKCHLKDINNKNGAFRQFSERAAINAPLQGTAADIIKLAMISLDASLKQQFPQARMLLQVHDELLIEAPEAIAQDVAQLVQREMQGAARLSIPLTVEVSVGDDWGSIH